MAVYCGEFDFYLNLKEKSAFQQGSSPRMQ